jgi:hypothetical protein
MKNYKKAHKKGAHSYRPLNLWPAKSGAQLHILLDVIHNVLIVPYPFLVENKRDNSRITDSSSVAMSAFKKLLD